MSRKKAEKSNIPKIGIFTDKSKRYNLEILEVLRAGAATPWRIAKAILKRQGPISDKDVIDSKSRRIYAVIQRKQGRLNDLANKGYVINQEGLWSLTTKGNVALAIQHPEIFVSLDTQTIDMATQYFREQINAMPSDKIKGPFGLTINRAHTKRDMLKLLQAFDNPIIFKAIVEETKEVLKDGIDLDRMSMVHLWVLLSVRAHEHGGPIKDLMNVFEERKSNLQTKGTS